MKNLIAALLLFSGPLLADCIDINPPKNIGQLALEKPVPKKFIKLFKPRKNKGMDSWFDTKAYSYRVVENKVTIIEFTPAKAPDCVSFKGKVFNKNLDLDDMAKLSPKCVKGPPAYGGTAYKCPHHEVQWAGKDTTIRIDDQMIKPDLARRFDINKKIKPPVPHTLHD